MTFTNKSGVEEGKDRGMAPLGFRVVRHGVYTVPFFVNPSAAGKSGCASEDIDLLFKVIPYIYDHTRSMIRSMVGVVHAWVIEHKTALGSFPEFQMIDALTPKVKSGVAAPMSLSDYEPMPTWESVAKDLRDRVASCRDLAAM